MFALIAFVAGRKVQQQQQISRAAMNERLRQEWVRAWQQRCAEEARLNALRKQGRAI